MLFRTVVTCYENCTHTGNTSMAQKLDTRVLGPFPMLVRLQSPDLDSRYVHCGPQKLLIESLFPTYNTMDLDPHISEGPLMQC